MTKKPVVISMSSAFVSEDGEVAEMELKNSDGSVQSIRFSPKPFLGFVSMVFEMFEKARIQKAASQGLAEVHPLPAVATYAKEALGGRAVILGVRLQNGLQVQFSVPPAEAEELHKQLGAAVEKSKIQSASNRH